MNEDNGFFFLIYFVVSMSPQLGGLGTKAQYLVISFRTGEGETLSRFYLRVLLIGSEIILLQDRTGKINNLTGKYIIQLSKWKHIQRYTTPFKIYYIFFEHLPQIQQLSITSTPTIE